MTATLRVVNGLDEEGAAIAYFERQTDQRQRELVAEATTMFVEGDLRHSCAPWCEKPDEDVALGQVGEHDPTNKNSDECTYCVNDEVVLIKTGAGLGVTYSSLTTPMRSCDLSVDEADQLARGFLTAVRVARGDISSKRYRPTPPKSRVR
jgi:hypothetical protein